jgi:hypothetical protein
MQQAITTETDPIAKRCPPKTSSLQSIFISITISFLNPNPELTACTLELIKVDNFGHACQYNEYNCIFIEKNMYI